MFNVSIRFVCYFSIGSLIALTGCASAPPVRATLSMPAVRVQGQNEQSHDGVSITVTPITPESINRYPQVYPSVTYTAVRQRTAGESLLMGSGVAAQQVTTRLPLVPYPSFYVRIANRTGHVVRLTGAIIRLQDNSGRQYPTFATTQELIAWNEANLGANASNPEMVNRVRQGLSSLQLLTRNVELLNGDEWSGFLVFNTSAPANYRSFMTAVERLTLRIAEVPVATNEAGAVTRTTEFSFVLNKAMTNRAVLCPAGTTEPSWETCQEDDGSSGGST